MFEEIDLSQAVPPNTVAITFRYEITGQANGVSPLAWMADNASGKNSILLAGGSGEVTVRLRKAQKLYYSLKDPSLHLNLWIVEYNALSKHSC
ncbi:MAG: hypothetical protein ACE5JU_08445 [Candidatus Binatia bacterium]